MTENYSTGDPVKLIDAENASLTAKMKGFEESLLSRLEAPSLVALEHHVDFRLQFKYFFLS